MGFVRPKFSAFSLHGALLSSVTEKADVGIALSKKRDVGSYSDAPMCTACRAEKKSAALAGSAVGLSAGFRLVMWFYFAN